MHDLGKMARLYGIAEMTFDVLMQATNLQLRESAPDPGLGIPDVFFAARREVTLSRVRHILRGISQSK